MPIIKRFAVWILVTGLLFQTASSAEIDSDGDGVIDSEDPNPGNSQVVPWRCLSAWHFEQSSLASDDGQVPVARADVTVVPNGYQGAAVQFGPGRAALRYRATSPTGRPNIAAIRGSIFLRLKPGWTSGSGPGEWATLVDAPNFSLRVSPNGSTLFLTSARGGLAITNAQMSLALRANTWSYILATYSPEETTLSCDAPSNRVKGTGLPPPSDWNNPDRFLAFGSAMNGGGSIHGTLDEVAVFNAPGVLGLNPTSLSAVVSESPRGLNLIWMSPTNAITELRRRSVGAEGWEALRPAFGTNFFDGTVVPGERYEYNLNTRIANLQTGLPDDTGQFIKASFNGTPLHERGKIVLLVDQTLVSALEPDLSGFVAGLVGDGWEILRANVPRHVDDYSAIPKFLTNYEAMVNTIKPFVRSNYLRFGSDIKYILCVGHVAVPYTGTIADDGHNSTAVHGAHTGAWASDLFYGDVDGVWTDTLNATNSSYSFNWNVPGDGRLDQNRIPENSAGVARLEIPVARIDLSYMPAFAESEVALLKRYFRKNLEFRRGANVFATTAISAEYVLPGSPLAAQLAAEMLSKVKVLAQPTSGDVFADPRSFLFGIESGPGAFDRINDALPNLEHTTASFARSVAGAKCAFLYLRGSYFPDWNTQNNFLRSVLALPNGGLTSAAFLILNKAWRADGLGVGLSIGNEMLDVVNTWSVPGNAQSVRTVEMLGDPTLRFPIVQPPAGPGWTTTKDTITVYWSAVPEAAGYYVYRSVTGSSGPFHLVNPALIQDTSFSETLAPNSPVYMIRAASLASTGGGSFTNLSQGIFTTAVSAP